MNQGTLTVEAYSREGNSRLGTGELLVLDNQINQATATLRLKAIFKNPDKLLWPNQFVKVRLLLTVSKDALVIPTPAVQRGPKGAFVYVVRPDETAAPRPVEVEHLIGDQAVIAQGLEPGEQVVVEGQNQLRPGARVQTRKEGGKGGDGGGSKAEGGKAEGGKAEGGKAEGGKALHHRGAP
jgi:multidrug efflux system membrane fusion protein